MRARAKAYLWRLFLRYAGNVVTAAEDWIHAQEVKLRENAAAAVTSAPVAVPEEFQVKASAARERAKRAARPRRPRLVYQAGQFVRQGVR